MLYKDFRRLKLSSLGLGTMRLPNKGVDSDVLVDEEETAKMVDYALKNGINYFDNRIHCIISNDVEYLV